MLDILMGLDELIQQEFEISLEELEEEENGVGTLA